MCRDAIIVDGFCRHCNSVIEPNDLPAESTLIGYAMLGLETPLKMLEFLYFGTREF